MQKDFYITVDMGKREIKAILFDRNGAIKKTANLNSSLTSVGKNKTLGTFDSPNKFIVGIKVNNGKEFLYEIGDEVIGGVFNSDNTKINHHHRICLISAISLLLEGHSIEDVANVNLIVGLPASHISIKREIEGFKNTILKLKNDGDVFTTSVNGNLNNKLLKEENIRFKLESVIAFQEGLAFIPRFKLSEDHPNSEKNSDTATIDIGGHNINATIFNSKGCIKAKKSKEDVGINGLLNDLKDELFNYMEDSNRDVSELELKECIINKKLSEDIKFVGDENNKDRDAFIIDNVTRYINSKMIPALNTCGINPTTKGRTYLFTGGGSNLLKDYLINAFKDNKECLEFSPYAKWDNCLSYIFAYLNSLNASANKLVGDKLFRVLEKEADTKLSNLDKDIKIKPGNNKVEKAVDDAKQDEDSSEMYDTNNIDGVFL